MPHFCSDQEALSDKEPTHQCRRHRCKFNPWVGEIPWRRNSNPLQYTCLENPMDRGAWQAIVHGVAKELDTTERLTLTFFLLLTT